MSVILDALRRSRKGGRAPRPADPLAQRQVPAGLGLGSSAAPTGLRPARSRFLGIGLLLVILLGVWAAIQMTRSLINTYAPPAPSLASFPSVRGTPTPAPPPTAAEPTTTTPVAGTTSTSPPTVGGTQGEPGARARSSQRRAPGRGPRPPAAEARASIPEPTADSRPQIPATQVPGSDVNHFDLAVRHHNLGNYEEALKHYLAVLAADEFNVEARNNLGLLYRTRGLTAEAIDQFRRAIAINPNYIKARSHLGVVLTDAGRLAEARAELRVAMAMEPRNVDLLVNAALVEKADQRRDAAIELLVRAIGYQPTHAAAHYNVGVLYEEQSSLALAYDHYTEFLKFAGPEQGVLLSDVQRRLLILKPKLAQK